MKFQSSEAVYVTFQGKTVKGEVFLASADRLSLVLTLDEHLWPYINLLPVLWTADGYVDTVTGLPVAILKGLASFNASSIPGSLSLKGR
jgi:hypothetical protein